MNENSNTREAIDGNDNLDAHLASVLDVFAKVSEALFEELKVLVGVYIGKGLSR